MALMGPDYKRVVAGLSPPAMMRPKKPAAVHARRPAGCYWPDRLVRDSREPVVVDA